MHYKVTLETVLPGFIKLYQSFHDKKRGGQHFQKSKFYVGHWKARENKDHQRIHEKEISRKSEISGSEGSQWR